MSLFLGIVCIHPKRKRYILFRTKTTFWKITRYQCRDCGEIKQRRSLIASRIITSLFSKN